MYIKKFKNIIEQSSFTIVHCDNVCSVKNACKKILIVLKDMEKRLVV